MTSGNTSSGSISNEILKISSHQCDPKGHAHALPSATKVGSALIKYSTIGAQRQHAHVRIADPAKTSQGARTDESVLANTENKLLDLLSHRRQKTRRRRHILSRKNVVNYSPFRWYSF